MPVNRNRSARRPFVSTLAVTFKKAQVSEDVEQVKKEHRESLKTLMDKYILDVAEGKAEGIKSAKEFVEVMKADLLLIGEATDRTETNTVDEMRVQQINTMLDDNNPEVKSLIDELYKGMNLSNDIFGGVTVRPEDRGVEEIEHNKQINTDKVDLEKDE